SAARAHAQAGCRARPRVAARRQPDGRRPGPAGLRPAAGGRRGSPDEAGLPDRRRTHRDPAPERGPPERARGIHQDFDHPRATLARRSTVQAARARGRRRMPPGGPRLMTERLLAHRHRLINDENSRWWTLAAMCFALFMLMLDNTVVNVALPSIQRDLHASLASLEWTVNAYTLTLAVLLVTGGRLGDIFGRRRMFLFGVVVF